VSGPEVSVRVGYGQVRCPAKYPAVIPSVPLTALPYTFQDVTAKCLINFLLRMNKFITDDLFGIAEADPVRRNFVLGRKGKCVL
jgi:hypothetical protein